MLTDRIKLILILGLLLGTLFLFGCVNIKRVVEIAGDNREQLPIRSLTITIDMDQRQELFDQLKKFAEKHSFEFQISDYASNGEIFQVWMLQDNIKIIANDIPDSPSIVRNKFYDQSRANPVSEETIKTIDELMSDLKTFIGEIPNVTIIEEK